MDQYSDNTSSRSSKLSSRNSSRKENDSSTSMLCEKISRMSKTVAELTAKIDEHEYILEARKISHEKEMSLIQYETSKIISQ